MQSTKPIINIVLDPVILETVSMSHSLLYKQGNIDQMLTCLRPATKSGAPKIYSQITSSKSIFHNYGHGGGGWTFIWASVDKAINQFKQHMQENPKITKQTKIVVVGGGCIGFATAILLYEQGYQNIKIIAEKLTSIASTQAGGYFSPSSMFLKTEKDMAEVADLTTKTFLAYRQITEGKQKLFKKGVTELFVYTGAEKDIGALETHCGMEELADAGLIPSGELVNVSFRGTDAKHRMMRFKTFFVNPVVMMNEFLQLAKDRGIEIQVNKLNSFDDINEQVIFNCSGLGARELAKDQDVFPILGHLITLKGQQLEKNNYIVLTKFSSERVRTKEEQENAGYLYFMPKQGGVIGGTYIMKNWGNDEEFNKRMYSSVLQRAQCFFGTKSQEIRPML